MKEAQPIWQTLQHMCRKTGIEVMYTVMESMTQDGRDRSLDYKISGKQLHLFQLPILTSYVGMRAREGLHALLKPFKCNR